MIGNTFYLKYYLARYYAGFLGKTNFYFMYIFKNSNCVVIWTSPLNVQQYFDWPINEAKKHFKQKFDKKGAFTKVNFCPYLFN